LGDSKQFVFAAGLAEHIVIFQGHLEQK